MTRADCESTCSNMQPADGRLWPISIVLNVAEEFAKPIGEGSPIVLRDSEGVRLAALHVNEVWQPDRMAEVEAVYGTTKPEHPGVDYVLKRTHPGTWKVALRASN